MAWGMITGLVKAGGDVAINGIKAVSGSRFARDQQSSDIRQAAVSQFAGEFEHAGDGWFDSFINGVNRIPRPLGFFCVIAYFLWMIKDPDGAKEFANNLTANPVWFTFMITGIVGFFYGFRSLDKHFSRRYRKSDQQAYANASATRASTEAFASETANDATEGEDGDTDPVKPALDPEIKAFNKRKRENFFKRQAQDR